MHFYLKPVIKLAINIVSFAVSSDFEDLFERPRLGLPFLRQQDVATATCDLTLPRDDQNGKDRIIQLPIPLVNHSTPPQQHSLAPNSILIITTPSRIQTTL